jgi:hypothetical protein
MGQNNCTSSYFRGSSYMRAFDTLTRFGAHGVQNISKCDPWSYPDFILQYAKLGDKTPTMNSDIVTQDDMVLNNGVASDGNTVANLVKFPDECPMSGLEMMANDIPPVDDGMGSDEKIWSYHGFLCLHSRGGRVSNESIILNFAVSPEFNTGKNPGCGSNKDR